MSERVAIKNGYTTSFGGFSFDLEAASLELLSIVLADKQIKEIFTTHDLPYFDRFVDDAKENRILRLLVEIAAQFRVMEWNTEKNRKNHAYLAKPVGELIESEESEPIDLTAKEACNKIIHAKEFVFDVSKVRNSSLHYLNPYIYIYGTKGKKSWKATLDLVLFCDAVNQNIDDVFNKKAP